MDSDQLFYVLPSVFGEKTPILYLGSKIFLSEKITQVNEVISFSPVDC